MNTRLSWIAGFLLAPCITLASAAEPGTVTGSFTLNGEPVPLHHAYVYREAKGHYDPADPTWMVVLSAEPVAPREVDSPFISPSLRIGLTLTSEFGDEPSLQVLSQTLRSASLNLSGLATPQMELTEQGPEAFAGRIHLTEPQTFFDDTYHYDLSFNALPVDPNAPIGDLLPKGGGKPGKAYIAWTRAVHAGDIKSMKRLVSPDMAAMLDEPEAAEQLELMAIMTPTDVRIIEGSSDGTTAILRIEGKMEGEPVKGEVTLERHGGKWVPTASSME